MRLKKRKKKRYSIRMLMRKGHRRLFHVVALGLLLFYGVASGRGFFPQLCNSLSAIGNGQDVSVLTSSSCCRMPGDETSGAKSCALCTLVCSLAEPVTYISFSELFSGVDERIALEPLVYVPKHTWTPASLRGPPVTV